MRGLTVAAGDGGIDPATQTSLLGWLGGALTAVLGAVGLWLANRLAGKAAVQMAINDGFKALTAELQEERAKLLEECKALRHELATAKAAWEIREADLKGDIRNLTQVVESLKSELRRHGIPIPAAPITGNEPRPGATILEEPKP